MEWNSKIFYRGISRDPIIDIVIKSNIMEAVKKPVNSFGEMHGKHRLNS